MHDVNSIEPLAIQPGMQHDTQQSAHSGEANVLARR